MPQIARIADAFRPWGVQVAISVDFGGPKTIGGLDTFDPLDPRVIAYWKEKVDQLYRNVPDLAGFVLKADSEGRVGPSAYGRTHADAANVVARALKPHNGLFFYRGFVYDHRMDWRNLKNDRARAAWDNFKELDGKFDDNVIIQIKNGPIDFQVREPASPLFGALEKTSQAIELQVTQEYFGQARHTVYLVPYWKDTLDFDMRAKEEPTPVKALVAGSVEGLTAQNVTLVISEVATHVPAPRAAASQAVRLRALASVLAAIVCFLALFLVLLSVRVRHLRAQLCAVAPTPRRVTEPAVRRAA
jgi:alpha-glucuronidase